MALGGRRRRPRISGPSASFRVFGCSHFELRFPEPSPATQPFRPRVWRQGAGRGLRKRRRCRVRDLVYGGAVSHGLREPPSPPGWTWQRPPQPAWASKPCGAPPAAEASPPGAPSAGAGIDLRHRLGGWARLRLCRPRVPPALTPPTPPRSCLEKLPGEGDGAGHSRASEAACPSDGLLVPAALPSAVVRSLLRLADSFSEKLRGPRTGCLRPAQASDQVLDQIPFPALCAAP